VYLVHAFRRSFRGSSNTSQPSRFLNDLPGHLISGGGLWAGEEKPAAAAVYSWNRPVEPNAPAQDSFVSPELKAGNHVRHAAFGEGVVVSCQSVDGDCEVVVAFQGAGVRKLLLSYAKLEKVEKQ
jgi:DNA helicase-2/ATP-dependent DNA helicase PcrA